MSVSNYDVVVVGAGAAGLTAAIGLARAGFAVAVIEAAAFPGAENWSGCVYFCENLAHPDILGPEGVEALAWERRLVERGFFACDGHSLLGMKYRDPSAFRHCYTVLRPIFDHHLAQVALRHGVALLASTTVESLIREGTKVIGVCTNRGPLYADLVFLAEGDASHLVTREGYERYTDQRESPKFLQGIKQVIELPPGAIEDVFDVGPEDGVAYEMLLRNGTLRGRPVHLNMGGFVYANRQSLSVGLVLPVDNLREHFDGDPNLLMEWFESLPALQPWLRDGKRGAFGAKIIRGGGAKDIPNLIDEGLAIGGAASAIGIDFPYPNFTGPATAMGLLITQAACRIRSEGSSFSRDNLRRYYLEPLERTHYWQDVSLLRSWPGYVKKTQVFFGRNLDLALGTAYVWTRPRRWFLTKWFNWLRLVRDVAGPGEWREMRTDVRYLVRALRLREVVSRPAIGRLLLDGTINAMRDLAHSPRANLPRAGKLRLHYSVAGETEPAGLPPAWKRWFKRLAPVLASAARKVYSNDDTPLSTKLPDTSQLLLRQINMLDVLATAAFLLAAVLTGALSAGWDRFLGLFRRRRSLPRGLYPRYALAAGRAGDLTPLLAPAGQQWEARLAQLAYQTVKASHIHVLWPKSLPRKNSIVQKGLWHVCPARVYEARVSPAGQLQVVVNFENCIKCETCWRSSDLVDWGRDGQHRFIYPVGTPVVTRLLSAVHAAGSARPALPRIADRWEFITRGVADLWRTAEPSPLNGQDTAELTELYALLTKLDGKLAEFDAALAREPRTVDRARAEYLEMLARYAQQLALRILEVLKGSTLGDRPDAGFAAIHQMLSELAGALVHKAEERARRTWDQRFTWAAADGRQLRHHHLAGIRCLLDLLRKRVHGPAPEIDPTRYWLRAEDDQSAFGGTLADWIRRLDAVFPAAAWRDLDRQIPLTSAQDAVLRDLISQVPVVDSGNFTHTLHAPLRKALLAELGRRDPSLAFRVASHLWARDLARLHMTGPSFAESADRWTRGSEWTCFVAVDAAQMQGAGWKGEALFVPAAGARSLLLLVADQLIIVRVDTPGLRLEPLATLGLRGAGLMRVRLDNLVLPETRVGADYNRVGRVWQVLSAADLVSIAHGMADQLCRRAIAHATGRVQFPGLFHDEEARDPIGKFGAVKKMVAQMAARRYLLETLDYTLSPTDFSSSSVERAALAKAIAAEALGTTPGSLSYNAGQIFGGTGFSEDDILSKFYRDASAWRFLGPANVTAYLQHGEQLLRSWHPDGRRLAGFDHEAQLFDQLAQRKALQAELDEVRVLRSRLRSLVNDWQQARREKAAASHGTDEGSPFTSVVLAEFTEQLARQDAHLLAGKALLLRTHARLEHSLEVEPQLALLRVWLEEASLALEEFESSVRHWLAPFVGRSHGPLVDPGAGPAVTRYAEFLAAPCPYDSGDFLGVPTDLQQPRLVPEMIEADPDLAARDSEFRELLANHFGGGRADGLPYERYIERQHRPDAEDLDFCRKHGFFRMPIPKELGGEGRRKVDYYLLITNAQRLSDVGISLTIQVNTSIGTTPILQARDKDLPKAVKDLGPFIADSGLHREIRRRVEKLIELASFSPKRVEQAYKEVDKRLEQAVWSRTALRTLAHRFVLSWQQAGQAARQFDMAAMRASLEQALAHWKEACTRALEMQQELGRRQEACDLYLRWIASGQISAFALTEPSAGSDTARVATRAQLMSVAVETEPDGVLHFVPAGGKDMRYLIDARRLEFRPEGVFYRWSETADPNPIHFDEYDYETDDPSRMRYYDHGDRRVHFTDVAQLRERDGRLWYDYWELNGAKMWITNGRMAGVMSLYAKTEEGVTGFMVDRHAEGFYVGKDEDKLGQLGSPTNELALQAVRVPRENVLGLEGRGQVNALEALNVGRAGLAMTAMAQMAGLIERSRAFAQAVYGAIPDWVSWRLQRMEEDRFSAEALAHEVVGRFEHPQTKSVRMESAISKMLVTEWLHHVIELAEDIYGLSGQTQLHLVEKRKRDARVLTIYEGTNEIQRFFILKDLASEVAPRWARAGASPLPDYLGRESLELEALKGEVRQRVTAALETFGQEVWQNPNLQANCFLLAESAAWLKAADSTLGRLAWLERQAQADESAEPLPKLELAQRALNRCNAEVRHRLRRFDEELAHLRRGYYAPEIRAASLLFDRRETSPHAPAVASQVERPLSVLVVVEPTVAAPRPQVAGGRLLEAYWTLSEADRSALEMVLRWRDEATAPVHVQVAAIGPKGYAQVLRETLSLGLDRARLVVSDGEALTPDSAASALAAALGETTKFDVVLGGCSSSDNEEGLLAELTAEALGMSHVGRAAALAIRKTAKEEEALLIDTAGRKQRVRSLPVAVSIEAALPLRPFTIEGYLAGLAKAVEVERWPKKVTPRLVSFQEAEQAERSSPAEEQPHPVSPHEAAQFAMDRIGVAGNLLVPPEDFAGIIADISYPTLPERSVLAVLAADKDGRVQPTAAGVLRAAALVAGAEQAELVALLIVPPSEDSQRRALSQVLALASCHVVLLSADRMETSSAVNSSLLKECWPILVGNPRAIVGEPWTEEAFGVLPRQNGKAGVAALRIRRVSLENDQVFLESAQARGKLRARLPMAWKQDEIWFITLTAGAETTGQPAIAGVDQPRIERWAPRLERFYGRGEIQRLLDELKQETGLVSLADAEFIVDVGFGIGNRDGYEAVIDPLEQALRRLNVRGLVIGGSRKVTEELHLLSADRQIGQSGVSVNPKLLLAIGISGAPQHLDYIGPGAIILAFNRDPNAPIMTLNQRQAQPRVYPVIGDLFDTIPAFIAALESEPRHRIHAADETEVVTAP
jgi:alkylation response protein AidB-like acyl-CoA dehydrogenase/flavin-dependent dehydrogenase/electron transfer flavoprotein alpha subunit/ferredoxin-like protein FixX